MPENDFRLEKDSMGELEVPSNALYGANTRRAQLNFPISQLRFGRSLIKSLGLIKQSSAETNLELNLIDEKIAQSIISSSQEIIDGKHDNSFVVDIFQTGSGTSTNMNVNEVISNLNNGVVDSRFMVPWENFENTLLVTNSEGLNKINTRIFKIIKID